MPKFALFLLSLVVLEIKSPLFGANQRHHKVGADFDSLPQPLPFVRHRRRYRHILEHLLAAVRCSGGSVDGIVGFGVRQGADVVARVPEVLCGSVVDPLALVQRRLQIRAGVLAGDILDQCSSGVSVGYGDLERDDGEIGHVGGVDAPAVGQEHGDAQVRVKGSTTGAVDEVSVSKRAGGCSSEDDEWETSAEEGGGGHWRYRDMQGITILPQFIVGEKKSKTGNLRKSINRFLFGIIF